MIVPPEVKVFGGAERLIVELANYLTNHNYPIAIFTTFAVPEFKQKLQEARILECQTEQNLIEHINMFAHKFEIVNPHNHPAPFYFNYPLKPIKVWQCNEPPGYVLEGNSVNPVERNYIVRTCKKVVVLGSYDRYRFQKIYGITPVVNYLGIDYDFYSQDVKVKHTLNMKDNFVITQVAYFTWTKNQVKTVEIFSEVKKQIPNAKLVLVGYDVSDYTKQVEQKVAELGLEDEVYMSGFINSSEQLRNLYKQSSVFVMPILSQGGWISTFEAISSGVPTIVSEDFVGSNLIQEHGLGSVVPLQTETFIKKILEVHDNLQNEQQKTTEAARWIGQNLTWENFGKRYEEIFEECLV